MADSARVDNPQKDPVPGSQPPSEVGGLYAYYVLGVLFVVYIFNFIDRQILAILLQPIKEDLKISDTALGFLTSLKKILQIIFMYTNKILSTVLPLTKWWKR